MEVKMYELVYIITYIEDCTNIPTYSQKGPKEGIIIQGQMSG